MKNAIMCLVFTSLIPSTWAAGIPAEVTTDLMKTNAIELLIGNVHEFYRITDFYGGRTTDANGKEVALGVVQYVKVNNECQRIVAAAHEESCSSVSQCEIEGYLLTCDQAPFFLPE